MYILKEPTSSPIPSTTSGKGRSRGEGRGSGPRPSVEMTASGPFAMGPAMAGSSGRRSIPRSNFTPVTPSDGSKSAASLGAGLSGTRAPSLKGKGKEPHGERVEVHDEDTYSDPDEGVEIVDMENVRQMDWMAPESLKRERNEIKRKVHIKQENKMTGKGEFPVESFISSIGISGNVELETATMDLGEAAGDGDINLADALDLSESEEEEELEDLMEDFALQANEGQVCVLLRLIFFY
jgi:DNA-directed RNA polymerase III subunit RPC4